MPMKIHMIMVLTAIQILISLSLKERYHNLKEIPTRNIFLGNGSDEILDLVFQGILRAGEG